MIDSVEHYDNRAMWGKVILDRVSLRGLEHLIWDPDDMEESGLQRRRGSEERQCRSLAGIQAGFWWLEYKQDKKGWEAGVVGTGQTTRALYHRL